MQPRFLTALVALTITATTASAQIGGLPAVPALEKSKVDELGSEELMKLEARKKEVKETAERKRGEIQQESETKSKALREQYAARLREAEGDEAATASLKSELEGKLAEIQRGAEKKRKDLDGEEKDRLAKIEKQIKELARPDVPEVEVPTPKEGGGDVVAQLEARVVDIKKNATTQLMKIKDELATRRADVTTKTEKQIAESSSDEQKTALKTALAEKLAELDQNAAKRGEAVRKEEQERLAKVEAELAQARGALPKTDGVIDPAKSVEKKLPTGGQEIKLPGKKKD